MNNSELEKKLKAARGPALGADYQTAFPAKVLANLRSSPTVVKPTRPPLWKARLWRALAAGMAILLAFEAGHWRGRVEVASPEKLLENTKLVRETLAMFPHQVRAIVQDEHGMNLVLSDKPDVPVSMPIYVSICDGKNCSSLVTFSGQEIQIAGQKLTVLSEADGGIILQGSQFLWSNGQQIYADKHLKIEAKNLAALAM